MTEASTAKPGDQAFDLFEQLTDGRTQSVFILDDNLRPLGLITQTDLLVAVARFTLAPAAAFDTHDAEVQAIDGNCG
jgi:CBS-domain-containing membrane protein